MMYLRIGVGQYDMVTFLGRCTRYLVRWELFSDLGGVSVGLAARTTLDKEKNSWEGTKQSPPEFQDDNAAATSDASSARCWRKTG